MPPKKKASSVGASKKSSAQKTADIGSKKSDKRRSQPKQPPVRPEVQYMQYVQSLGSSVSVNDIAKMTELILRAERHGDTELLELACVICLALCSSDEGLINLVMADGVVPYLSVAKTAKHSDLKRIDTAAVDTLFRHSIAWLDDCDEIDFHELPAVMKLAHSIAPYNADVAQSALVTMGRFAVRMPENRTLILQKDGLPLLHMLLSTFRQPDIVQEVFTTLFKITDVPLEIYFSHLHDELDIIATIVESIEQAPFNMRLQMAGARLLAHWASTTERDVETVMAKLSAAKGKTKHANEAENQRRYESVKKWQEVPDKIRDCDAAGALQRALDALAKAHLDHSVSWLHIVGRAITALGPPQRTASKLSSAMSAVMQEE